MHIKVRVSDLEVNQIVATDLYSPDGVLMLGAGTVLNETRIQRLRTMGVLEVWIERENTRTLNPGRQLLNPTLMSGYDRAARELGALFERATSSKKVEIVEVIATLQRFEEVCEPETNPFRIFISLLTDEDTLVHHSIRVAMLSKKLGEWMGLDGDACEELQLAGALHDIGKTQLPAELVRKQERLTDADMMLYQTHPSLGYEVLQNSRLPERIALVAKNHHETLNGQGYPYGLREEEIDLYSRIVAVANEFVNLTSRTARYWSVSLYNALDELSQMSFGKLDPHCVWQLTTHLKTFFIGNLVELSDSTTGRVVYVSPYQVTKPLIRTGDVYLDLTELRHLSIRRVLSW
ncbi:HD domain-containing protein [Tumebacillus sp. ITR2]|uniref:HD domain-containing protein n=1 Tax=Tumebacillus amylolyticus TaxID=2801339 RepID=A0ABS1JCT0_9BACL|nr:HD domain-containing phosphohydrolase [Tumebacillus amylolyticus]MBL0388071.1 HD domain-containing protein [Tumebacillus amylolyticus]